MTTSTAAPIGWFEIAGSDMDKTEAFYGAVLNWTFDADPAIGPSYHIVDAGDGVAGGVTTATAGLPETYAIFSAMVSDVQATCDAVIAHGGTVLVGPQAVDETGLVFANLADPDGNHFGVFSPPASWTSTQ